MTKRWLGLLVLGAWLGGSGVAHAAFNPPPPLGFGNVTVGQSSTLSTTMTATGGTDVTVTVVLHGGNDCDEFQVVSPLAPVRVRVGMDQTVQIKFAPIAPGDKTCTVDINIGTNPFQSFVASGHAAAPGIDVAPAGLALSYGSVEVGATSATQTVTATNNGDATLTISSAALSSGAADYTVTGATSTTLAPLQSTNWAIACKPSTQDARPGTFRILSDAFGIASVDVSLTCNGTQGNLTTIPTSHDFGGVTVGASVPFNFQLKNTGNLTVTNLTGALADTTKGYTFDTTTVPNSLAAGATANLTVTFTPTSGTSGGAVNLNFSGRWGTSNTPTTAALALNGDGQVASFTATPTPLAFGNFRFDTAPALPYHIKNTGDVAISIDSVTFMPDPGTAPGELTFTTVTPGTVLTPTQQIDVTVTALPANRTGAIGGKVTVHSNTAGTSDQTVTITGNATAATFTATASTDFGAVDVTATPPTRTVTIQNGTTASLDINSIAPAAGSSTAFTYATLPTTKTTLAPNAKLDITVTYHPTTVRAPGDFDSAVLVATLGGVLNGPVQAMMAIQGRGIDSQLTVQAMPNFPATFRNPGDKAPVRAITVHNNGEAVLKITQASVTGGPVWQLVDANPVDIPGGASHDFMVKFAPTEIGVAPSGQLILVQNGGARPNVSVTLTGTCMKRNIAFGPAPASPGDMPTISFPFTRTDLPVTISDALAIVNQDPSVGFTVHALTIDANPAFTLLDAPADAPLPVGATDTIGITFRPPSLDHFETVVHLYVDQDPTVEAEVRLVGDAVFGEAHGSGGCNAGGAGRGGGWLVGLAALGVLRLRRRRRGTAAAARLALIGGLVTAASIALAPGARADDIIGIGVFQPAPATAGTTFALQAPEVGARGSLAISGLTSYASNPLVMDWTRSSDSTPVTHNALVSRSILYQLGIAYAALDRLEVGARFPIFQQSGDAGPGGPAAKGTAYGDLTLHGKLRVLQVGLGLGTLALGASAGLTLPTATKNQFVSTGGLAARLLALGSFTPAGFDQRLTLTANAGSVVRGRSQYDTITEQSAVAWGGGAQVRIIDELWLSAEVFGEVTPSALQQKSAGGTMPPAMTTLSQIEGLVGFTLKPTASLALGLAGGRGVNNALGTPDVRGVFSLSFVPGAAAIAPIHAERPDGDADGDGIPDSVDKCPNEPEDKDGFEDADGCPDPDNDHDGIPDAADKCPLDPEDKDGFQDADGCPDKDNDGDGIPDAMDKCPNDPEDKDGFEDLDGCPDPDNDHDGIPDDKDRCPNEPETINGIQDDDGCPDKGDSTIILSPDKIETLDPIQFTGLKLAKTSLPLLAQVGATLRAHSEIVRLRITVHVQPSGNAEADQTRSDKRAQVIRDWLIQWGIAPARLEARGFGGIKPLVPPDQKGAARINDRLELIILERK